MAMKVAAEAPSPPLILALETSGSCGSVAVVDGRGCRAEYSLQSSRTHSRRLLETVERVMVESETDWRQLDALAVGLGPGSFTGLRIGLSSAKGLALATGKPLLGISSLDGLAAQAIYQPLPVCALIDARKQEVFAAFYRTGSAATGQNNQDSEKKTALSGKASPIDSPRDKANDHGLKGINGHHTPPEAMHCDHLQRTGDYLALPPARLGELISRPTLLLGSGAELYRELLTEQLGKLAVFAPPQLYFARAATVAWLAQEHWRRENFVDPGQITPIYVRAADAKLP